MEGLGTLLPSDFGSLAIATSADGAIVVGTNNPGSGLNDYEAFVWDELHGMRSVQELLIAEGFDLAGWKLNWATDVSADGTTIVGWGKNPSGQDEGWLARINSVPEPSGVVLAVLALLSLMRPCRLRRHQKLPA